MSSVVYKVILNYVNTECNQYISITTKAVADAIAPAAYTLLGIYIMLWGVASMRGLIQEPITEAAGRLIKIALIFGIGIQLAHYNDYVTSVFFDGPLQLASAIQSPGNQEDDNGIFSILDKELDNGFSGGKKFWDKGGVLHGDFGMYLIAIFVWAITIAVTAYACFLIVLSKMALAVIISIGPIFIISLLFQSTGNFFNSWVQQLCNYFLIVILTVATTVMIMGLYTLASATLVSANSSTEIVSVFPFIVTALLSLLVLAQIPHIASGLAGGISLSSYGVGRLGLSVSKNTARGMAKQGTKLGVKTVKAGYSSARKVYMRSRRNAISQY